MAAVENKVVTVESLGALHDYNVETFLPKVNPEITGNMFVSNNGIFGENAYVMRDGSAIELLNVADVISIYNGGTGSSKGSTGLKNLFADGETILSSYQYGDTLPEAGIRGRIFFKKLAD